MDQNEYARLIVAVEDLRRRNGELSLALLSQSHDSHESITPRDLSWSRHNRLTRLLQASEDWYDGEISDQELRESVESLRNYLPEWNQQQVEGRKRTAKAREVSNGK